MFELVRSIIDKSYVSIKNGNLYTLYEISKKIEMISCDNKLNQYNVPMHLNILWNQWLSLYMTVTSHVG